MHGYCDGAIPVSAIVYERNINESIGGVEYASSSGPGYSYFLSKTARVTVPLRMAAAGGRWNEGIMFIATAKMPSIIRILDLRRIVALED